MSPENQVKWVKLSTIGIVFAIAVFSSFVVFTISGWLPGVIAFACVLLTAYKAKSLKAIPRTIALSVGMILLVVVLAKIGIPYSDVISYLVYFGITSFLPRI